MMMEQTLKKRKAEFRVLMTQEMIHAFADLSGDKNPLHVSPEHAAQFGFPDRVAHGMLLGGLVSQLVGEHLPGGDVLLLSVKMDFHQPTHAGDELMVRGEIVSDSPSTRTMEIQFQIHHSRGVACKGTALVQVPQRRNR